MGTKIGITITTDDELPREAADAAMARTITKLQGLGLIPLRKMVLTVECADDDAEDIEDTIDAALSGRPMGVEVVLKTTRERHVERQTLAKVTPMDQIEGFAERHGVERVELSAHGRTVELTSQTARNAAAMLQDVPVGSDTPPRR